MKKKIHVIINKILGKKENIEAEERETQSAVCVGSTDYFAFNDGILYVEGWVFDTIYPMSNPIIAFYQDENKVKEIIPFVVYREDVKNVLSNIQAESSGFFFEVYLKSYTDLSVYYEYNTPVGIGKFHLGEVVGTSDLKTKIDIQSVHKTFCIGNIREWRSSGEYFSNERKRLGIQYELLKARENIPVILAFNHMLGGGATAYLIEKKKNALEKGYCFLTIGQDVKGPTYYMSYEYKDFQIEFFARDIDNVLHEITRLDEIWINELVTYSSPYGIMQKILKLKTQHQARVIMMLHDYYAICPAVNLMNEQGRYCEAPSEEICNNCIPKNRSNACLEYVSGSTWRCKWGKFLEECDEVRAFSKDTARLIKKIYPELSNITIVPHQPHILPVVNKTKKTTNTLNIGLLGVLCYKKGLDIVKDLVGYIEQEKLNIKIKLIGISDEAIQSPVFSYTGRYQLEEIPELTRREDIDIFLIPSIWPETFSYTTSEIISMNMPIAIFPIGAPLERVEVYEKGLVLSSMKSDTIISEIWRFMKKMQEFTQDKDNFPKEL